MRGAQRYRISLQPTFAVSDYKSSLWILKIKILRELSLNSNPETFASLKTNHIILLMFGFEERQQLLQRPVNVHLLIISL